MPVRSLAALLALALGLSGAALAQHGGDAARAQIARATPSASLPEVVTDPARLPPAVARMRARILDAARTGDLHRIATVMQSNETMPIFSFGKERDPIAFWKSDYPHSKGLEIPAILIEILETGFVHVDRGTPREMYVWPYFARTPLKELTPEQTVELLKLVTGSDFREMWEMGAYSFFRVGIGPDGTWHYFVAGQ